MSEGKKAGKYEFKNAEEACAFKDELIDEIGKLLREKTKHLDGQTAWLILGRV